MTRLSASTQVPAWLVAALCLTLGACNTARDASSASLEESIPPPAGSKMQALAPSTSMAPVAAVAALPEDAGAPVSVRGHGYVDGFRQDILLKGSDVRGVENGVTVLVRTSQQATLDERVPLSKPSETGIRSEIGRAFPHLAMKVVERPSSNGYGAYGLALGRAGGTIHCVYMWQWIERGSLPNDLAGPVSVRIRLCKADTTFDALAAMLDHLTISPDAASQTLSAAIVDPPSEVIKPHFVKPTNHRAHRLAVARRDEATMTYTAPASLTATVAAAPATPQSAVDLPPQAFLGPTAHPLKQN